MVHKKYIKKDGKVFGPYLYENYRDKNGITRTRYLGSVSRKNLQVNSLILIGFALLFIVFLLILFNSKIYEKMDLGESIFSEKFFSVSVRVLGNNDPPEILDLDNEIFVCENQALDKLFHVRDKNGDNLSLQINPITHIPFWIIPNEISGDINKNPKTSEARIITIPVLNKYDIDKKRIGNNGWGSYDERVSVTDNIGSDYNDFNITVLEINNFPEISNPGARTVWTKGDSSNFYYKFDFNDKEGDKLGQGLNANISFLNSAGFFSLDGYGVINFSANESLVPIGDISKVYDLRICVNDSSLKTISHKNISICDSYYGYRVNSSKTSCLDFSITITRQNRLPVILGYYPNNFSFNANGKSYVYFNISVRDPDGTIPDVSWYYDNNKVSENKGVLFSELSYFINCGISGNHNIRVNVSDGLNNTELIWNISVNYADCNIVTPPSGGGGGGGGGAARVYCSEEWACQGWSVCENLKSPTSLNKLKSLEKSSIKSRCDLLKYNDDFCGFQLRLCKDVHQCNTTIKIPDLIKECYYTSNPNCNDGILNCHDNGCEVLVDCGGPCAACPTCNDGIKNQNETSIDCGGICKKCPIEEPLGNKKALTLVISFALIIFLVNLLILLMVLLVNQIRRYVFFKKISDKENERIKSKGLSFIILVSGVLILALMFGFFVRASFGDKIVIVEDLTNPGFASYGVSSFLIEGFAKVFMMDIVMPHSVHSVDENTRLEVGGDTDDSSVKKYTGCNDLVCNKVFDDWNVNFYANYTNQNNPIDSLNGNCYIVFYNDGNTIDGMNYNPGSLLWEYNRSFINKGDRDYNVNCTSYYNNLSLDTSIKIYNTDPFILKNVLDGFIKANVQCNEDSYCNYSFKTNVSEDDLNDNLIYNFDLTNTTLTNFSINSSTGVVGINITHSNYTGNKKIELNVRDSESSLQSGILKVFIQEINDAPIFLNLENKSLNMTEYFEYSINIYDEEKDIPFILNISFISCITAPWSSRNNINCELFNISNYNLDSNNEILRINFTPSENDVGDYLINFSLRDNRGKFTEKIVKFNVKVINKPPFFTYVCGSERNAVEDSDFLCWINASDIYEENNLTFISNQTWFLDSKMASCNFSTGFNSSVNVSFIPRDENVGKWKINISVFDTGIPVKYNSSIIDFIVENKNDSLKVNVSDLRVINGIFYAYSDNNYQIQINASDEDLKIPFSNDPDVYQEEISFSALDSSNNIISWINFVNSSLDKNNGVKTIYLNFSTSGLTNGNYFVNISVNDKNSFSQDYQSFTINIGGNIKPKWNFSKTYSFNTIEDNNFILNLNDYAYDEDFDSLIYSFKNYTRFDSFKIQNDLVNFTSFDSDVGYHLITISASDGKSFSDQNFEFYINNNPDSPFIKTPFTVIGGNRDGINLIFNEDNSSQIFMFVEDNDFAIPLNQRSFYNENLSINLSIQGPNPNLFKLNYVGSSNPDSASPNLSQFSASFIPRKADVGFYNISINISDKSNLSSFVLINLSVFAISHSPSFANLDNYSAIINEEFFIDINSNDIEDINDSYGKLYYDYEFLIDGDYDFINNNESIFNSTSGVLNYTFNESNKYHINLTVTDSDDMKNSNDFWIFVYGNPKINYPLIGCGYNLTENLTSFILINAGHLIENNLSYEIYLDNDLRNNISYYGNNSDLNLSFIPNYKDESYGAYKNLTIIVLNHIFMELNDSIICNVKINHSNAPIIFKRDIGDKSTTYNNQIAIDLRDHFYDEDNNDSYYNQTLNFRISSNNISIRVDNMTLILSSNKVIKENIYVIGDDNEYYQNSNNFTIEFTEPATIPVPTPTPTPSSGGGGGSSNIIYLKLISPDRINVYSNESIDIPLSLFNGGSSSFSNIKLTSYGYKEDEKNIKLRTSLSKDSYSSLDPGKKEKLNLRVFFDNKDKLGNYKVFINLSSQSPEYKDWSVIDINLQAINESRFKELIKFTEELIASNPECIEIKEVLDEAKDLQLKGDYVNANLKTEEAINSCKNTISQVSIPRKKANFYLFGIYLFLAIASSFVIGILYYVLKKRKIQNIKEQIANDEKSSFS